MRVSGCMIVKNEERCIARCIESYRDIVDEIIVVDTGSTDRTVEIAESYGAQVIHFPWIDDFAAAKNQALERATGDWILFLDADEFFRPGDAKRLMRYLREYNDVPSTHILTIRLVNIEADGTRCPDQPFLQSSRVFRGNVGIRYQGAIHEDIRQANGALCTAQSLYDQDLMILHDGYMKDIVKSKILRNHEIILAELERTPDRLELHDYLSHGYSLLGDNENAMKHVMIAIHNEKTPMFHRARAFFIATSLYQKMGRSRNALMDLVDDAKPWMGEKAQYHNIRGTLLMQRHKFADAIVAYDRFLELLADPRERIFTENLLTPKILAQAMYSVAIVYIKCGEKDKAIRTLAESMNVCRLPENAELYVQVTADSPASEVLEVLDRVYAADVPEDTVEVLDLLRRYRVDEVYYTYFERYFAATGAKDVHFLTMLEGIGEGAMAVPGYLERYAITRETLYLGKAFVAAMLSDREDMLWRVYDVGNAEYRAFVEFWLDLPGDVDRPFSVDEYVAVLGDLFAFPSHRAVLNRWIQLGRQISPVLVQRVAILLFDKMRYEHALPLLEEVYEAYTQQHVPQASVFALHCCKACFFLGRTDRAIEYLHLAFERGRNIVEIGEFARLIARTVRDDKLRRDLERIAQSASDVGPFLFKDVMTPIQNEAARRALLTLIDKVGGANKALYMHMHAVILNRQGDVAASEREFKRAFEAQTNLALALIGSEDEACLYEYRDMPVERHEDCPVCGAHAKARACLDIIADAHFDRISSPIRVWMGCPECGHAFVRDTAVGEAWCEDADIDGAIDVRAALMTRIERAEGDAVDVRAAVQDGMARDPQAEETDRLWIDGGRRHVFSEASLARLCASVGWEAERAAVVRDAQGDGGDEAREGGEASGSDKDTAGDVAVWTLRRARSDVAAS